MPLYRMLRLAVFWSTALFTYASALLPGDAAPSLGASDKLDHMSAFFTLTLLGRVAFPRRPVWLVAAGLSAFGAFIEFSQAIPFFHRDASLLDWVADSGAILVGLIVAHIAQRLVPRLFVA